MFFEGSEKKIEITTVAGATPLRSLGGEFWRGIVKSAQAEVLSTVSNEHCDAYLLSESSLFVWDHRFAMLTCGTTTLVEAVTSFIEQYGEQNIAFANYQRKNEYVSQLQKTTFAEDLAQIREHISGDAYRIGYMDAHHSYIFSSDKPYQAEDTDTTSELLMYHIRGEAADYLRSENQTIAGIREQLKLDTIFVGFELDDFLFEPYGYSVNGIKDDMYFTIHITPQEDSSYVSLETNLPFDRYPVDVFSEFLRILNPGSWDIIGFNSALNEATFPESVCLGTYHAQTHHGYQVDFRHYQSGSSRKLIAAPM